jgi:DNA-binding MarR family transcriptional regulator
MDPADETAPLDPAVDAFFRASRSLVGIAVRSVAAAPVPLTVPQHRLLVLTSERGPHRVGDLARELGVNQSNASRLVDRMVAQGLVRRSTDPADRRASIVEPTPAGHRVLEAVAEHRLRELRSVVERMPPGSRERAVEVLGEFEAAARADRA